MGQDFWKDKYKDKMRILRLCPEMENRPGIYTWYRIKEIAFYSGQSVKLVDRSVQHLEQYDHLGNSIRTHGLYSKNNPFGWRLRYYYCDESELNEKERQEIAKNVELGYLAYNITSGGQDSGKSDINQRASGKTYREGVAYGYEKCRKEIKEMFEKYLDFRTKSSQECYKKNKDGELKEIYVKKFNEFKEWLENGEPKNTKEEK